MTPTSKKGKGKTTEKKPEVSAEKFAPSADAKDGKMDVEKKENSNVADGGDEDQPVDNTVTNLTTNASAQKKTS